MNSNIIAVRSIPLSQETSDAWRSVGVNFLIRGRNGYVEKKIAERYPVIFNLGNVDCRVDGDNRVYNTPNAIRAVSLPLNLRETMPDFLPASELNGPHWHKQGGYKGQGKKFHEKFLGECAVTHGDVQAHVDGVEFRVITVGDTVVQAHRKEGDVESGFDWFWVGVAGVNNNGIIPTVKEAIQLVPDWEHTIFGWDIIATNKRPYVIEINTCPGVNTATAERIVNRVES